MNNTKSLSTFIDNNKKKKKRRMRILGARIFLSFLAGKLSRFKQLLLTELLSIKAENLQVCDLQKKEKSI